MRVLPDKIEILSHPGADRSISMEHLKNYRAASRRYRNRRIGEFLKELHLTEGRNTGFQKIIRALKENGSPMPVFETDDERTYFLTTIPIHSEFPVSNRDNGNIRKEGLKEGLTEKERRIINLIEEDASITVAIMSAKLGYSRTTVEKIIRNLKVQGIIDRKGAKRNGKWIVLK